MFGHVALMPFTMAYMSIEDYTTFLKSCSRVIPIGTLIPALKVKIVMKNKYDYPAVAQSCTSASAGALLKLTQLTPDFSR